jgi:transposase-like protein
MTEGEQIRLVTWRLKVLQHADEASRGVAQTCRHFGISRPTFYKWKKRYAAAEAAGLCDGPRTPRRSPRRLRQAIVSTILYLRQTYHFGAARIARLSETVS